VVYPAGEPPEEGGAVWLGYDCERPEDTPCLHPGEPCPCKSPEVERAEWVEAMEERLRKARILCIIPYLEDRVDRATVLVRGGLLEGVK
jgi:hypothetical protein